MEFRVVSKEEQEEIDRDMPDVLLKPNYDEANPPEHTGLFFRGFNNVFFSDGQYAQKRGYKLLKRKSCKGCPTCDFIFDDLLPTETKDIFDIGEVKNGKIYELKIKNDGGTYEYPNDVDYWTEFEEVRDD